MICPVDGAELVMSDRQGIEIDYCPKCRGVWLDRGEIDKIVERSVTMNGPAPAAPQAATYQQPQQGHGYPQRREYDDDDDYHHGHSGGQHGQHHKRRESWLGDLFD